MSIELFEWYLLGFGLTGSLLSVLIMYFKRSWGVGFFLLSFLICFIYGLMSKVFAMPIPESRSILILTLGFFTTGLGVRVVNCFFEYYIEPKGRDVRLKQQEKKAMEYGIDLE